jgi:hypothetical protein
MDKEKQLSTLETQDLIFKHYCEELERRHGKTLRQLIDEANTPKKEWYYRG